MRWFWIDRFLEFESGRRAVAIKNVSLAEEHLHEHFPGFPVMPHPLVVEGIAQTGGLLVGEHRGFRERVVLAKITSALFHGIAVPGDTLRYTAVLEDIRGDGAFVHATSYIGEQLHAEVKLVFAHLDRKERDQPLFVPAQFLAMLRLLGMYEVGRDADGNPLVPPDDLLAAERRNLGETA